MRRELGDKHVYVAFVKERGNEHVDVLVVWTDRGTRKADEYRREMGILAAAFTYFYEKWALQGIAVETDPSGFQREWFSRQLSF